MILPFAWLALASCAEPRFPAVDGSAADTAAPPIENYTCEEPDQVFCASGTCGRICHRTDVERKPVAGHCDDPVIVDGKRFDNCEDKSVCLEPAPNTSQRYFCFRLCTNKTDCSGGVACTERSLSKDATLRVCDPSYQNCEGGCCDPSTGTGSSCSLNRPCYLV